MPSKLAISQRHKRALAIVLAATVVILNACGDGGNGGRNLGPQSFVRGDPFLVIQSTNLSSLVDTFLCISCSEEEFSELEAPAGFEKSAVLRLAASNAQLRKLPTDQAFIGFTDTAGNEYQNDARFDPRNAALACAPPEEFCGAMIQLESDRTFVYDTGASLHTVGNDSVLYALYATFDTENLSEIALPAQWSYRETVLEDPVVADSHGFPNIFRDARGNLWQCLTSDC